MGRIWLPACQRGLTFIAACPRHMGEALSVVVHPTFTWAWGRLAQSRFTVAARDEWLIPHSCRDSDSGALPVIVTDSQEQSAAPVERE